MLSFEPELENAPPALIRIQRREIFSLYPEIRILAWLGAMLIASGVSVFIAHHVREIGPLTIAIAIAAIAAGCYARAWMRRGSPSLVDDSILMLGAMLVSADAGWIESQWHLAGPRMLLIVACIHAAGAYAYESRALLSLAISAIAAWLGIDRKLDLFFETDVEIANRFLLCAAILMVWRESDRRIRRQTTFTAVFDHTAITLAFWGSLILTFNSGTHLLGLALTLALAAIAVVYAFRKNAEPFLFYAAIYATIAVDAASFDLIHDGIARTFIVMLSAIAAVIALLVIHVRFRRNA